MTKQTSAVLLSQLESALEDASPSSNLTGSTNPMNPSGANTDTLLVFHGQFGVGVFDAAITRYQETGTTVNSTVEDFNDKLSIVVLFDDVSGFSDVNIV